MITKSSTAIEELLIIYSRQKTNLSSVENKQVGVLSVFNYLVFLSKSACFFQGVVLFSFSLPLNCRLQK